LDRRLVEADTTARIRAFLTSRPRGHLCPAGQGRAERRSVCSAARSGCSSRAEDRWTLSVGGAGARGQGVAPGERDLEGGVGFPSRVGSTRDHRSSRVHRRSPDPVRGRADLSRAVWARGQDRPEHLLGGPQARLPGHQDAFGSSHRLVNALEASGSSPCSWT